MTIEQQRAVGSMVVLDVSGKVVLGDGDGLLKETVSGLMQKGLKKVVLNMSAVSYVDSAGLGALVGSSLAAKKQGGVLKLLNPSKRLYDLLTMSRLLQVIEVCDSESQALASFDVSAANS